MIREEYPLTSWIGWSATVARAIASFVDEHGMPDLLILSKAMHRRMSIAACSGGKFAPLRAVGTVDGPVHVVVEPDAGEGHFALVKAQAATSSKPKRSA